MFKKNLILLFFLIILLGTILPSCANKSIILVSNNKKISMRKMNFPKAEYLRLIWLKGHGLTAVTLDIYQSPDQQIKFAYEGDPDLHPAPLPTDPRCNYSTWFNPYRTLPDGRIGLIEDCHPTLDSPVQSYFLAYDPNSQMSEQIIAGSLVTGDDFTWNPEMTRGVQQMYNGIFGTLFWISPEGSEPMQLILSDGQRSWSLAENYPEFPSEDSGIAKHPAWSPDGKTIAFWASFDAIGKSHLSRMDVEYRLVFLNPENLSYRLVLDGIFNPYMLEWSPDNKWLSFFGKAGIPRKKGLYIFSLEQKQVYLIASGDFQGSPAWYPNGKSIAAIFCYELICNEQEIREYDLSKIIQ